MMEWVEFLRKIAIEQKLSPELIDTLIVRLKHENTERSDGDLAENELQLEHEAFRKRMSRIYEHFKDTCPELKKKGKGKIKHLRAYLWQQYERQQSQPPQPEPVGIPNNLPLSGTPAFVGRESDWEWLCTEIQKPTQSKQPVIVSLAGMGGVGKTELAIRYARQHLNDYPGGICWIFAREFEVGPQIVSFAVTQFDLQIPEGFDLSEQLDFCWRRWPEGDVLLVLDDVEAYNKVEPYLPSDDRFKVLITTRRVMGSPVRSRSLEVLTQDASLELLASEALVGQSRLESEQSTAERLCEWLGYLPLGLELVGRYLNLEPDLSLSTMLFNLQHQALKEESLVRDPEDENWSLTAQRGVAAAFELSWAKLKEDPRRLGRLLGLFALAPIPWELVESAEQYRCDLFPQNGAFDPENLSKARRELVGLHLLKRVEQGVFLLHALIRKFFQQKLEELDGTSN